LRISGSEVTPEGLTIEDMKKFARVVDGKVAMINVSEGTFHIPSTTSKNHPSMLLPPGCNTYLATAVKSAVKKTKISAVGGIVHPDMMEDIIAAGKADMIALIRALIADPDLPRKARDGRANDITPCQRCLVCLSDDFVPYVKYPTHTAKCTVNPIIGRETEVLATVPTEGRKRALIAGGGPAGMQAALTASKRGHQVILCEQGTELGGAIRYAKHVSFKEALDRFMRVLVARVESDREIMLMLNTKVTPELAKQLEPDVLVAAIGAQAIVPQIPGIDRPHVIQAVGMHDRMIQGEPIGENVVIIGGGLVGCEEALDLARKGHTVTVVEMREAVAINSAFLHRHALLLELETFDTVKLLVKTQCKEILDVGVCVVCEDEEEVLPSDTVIISVGMRPLCDEVESLRECAPDFQVIGDSWQPRRVQEAIKMGYDVGMHI
jgi:NADPH-dependent 2,4-dienoyl-CoA reductase/sulfur reductase-like enzyme